MAREMRACAPWLRQTALGTARLQMHGRVVAMHGQVAMQPGGCVNELSYTSWVVAPGARGARLCMSPKMVRAPHAAP